MEIFKTPCFIRRRVVLYLTGGLGITLILSAASMFFSWLIPYRDKPMMPKPFFISALLPGLAAGSAIEANDWIRWSAYLAVNSLAYGIGIFFLDAVRIAVKDNRRQLASQKSKFD